MELRRASATLILGMTELCRTALYGLYQYTSIPRYPRSLLQLDSFAHVEYQYCTLSDVNYGCQKDTDSGMPAMCRCPRMLCRLWSKLRSPKETTYLLNLAHICFA